MKCKKCNINFPEELIQSMCVSGKYIDVCPICALKIRNKLMGLPADTPFSGEMAQEFYERAKEYLSSRKG